MVHPSTLDMPALKLIEFFKVVQDKPVYICDIHWKPEWKGNRLQLFLDILQKCVTDPLLKSWIDLVL